MAVLAAGILFGAAWEIVTDPPYRREHWPFSPYQMYSRLPGDTWIGRRMFGVTAETPSREIPLLDDPYLEPMELVSLASSLDRMDRSVDRERLLTAALRDCLDRYEARRRAGRHDGPPLASLRLYRLGWRIEPPGRSILVEKQPLLEVAARSGAKP